MFAEFEFFGLMKYKNLKVKTQFKNGGSSKTFKVDFLKRKTFHSNLEFMNFFEFFMTSWAHFMLLFAESVNFQLKKWAPEAQKKSLIKQF